jgi:branched-chain amino acid transport system substrate-binding protein
MTRPRAWTGFRSRSRLAAAVLAMLFLAAGQPAAAKDWRIGAAYPLSGNLSVLGTEALAGAQIAVDMINEKGGVAGGKVVLVKSDVTDPTTATNEARRLITQEHVQLLVGTYGSSISLALAAVANQFKVPYFEGAAVSDMLTSRGHRYVFRINDNADALARALVDAVPDLIAPRVKKDPKSFKVALIHEDSAFGSSIAKDAVEHAKRRGLDLGVVEPYDAKTQDLAPLVLRMKSLNPDALLAVQYFNDAILFWRQARENGYSPKNFVAIGSGQSTTDYVAGVGKDAEGVLIADVPSAGVKPDALSPEARALQAEFIKRYQAKMGKPPASHATRHFAAMTTLFGKILPAAKTTEGEAFRKAVLALDEPIGSTILGFGLKFREDGQNERMFNVILQWQKGRLLTVWPERFATAPPIMIPLPTWAERDAAK